MKPMLMFDKYDDCYREVIDIEEIDAETLKELIKNYIEKNSIREIKIDIEDLYAGKKKVDVYIREV